MPSPRRLLITVGCLGLIALLHLGLAPAATPSHAEPWIHVKVVETGPDGETVRVNVPISLFQALIPLIESSIESSGDDDDDDSAEVVRVEADNRSGDRSEDSADGRADERSGRSSRRHRSHDHHGMTVNGRDISPAEMRAMLEAFRKAEDGEYITVDGTDETVRVMKSGSYFLVNVDDRGDHPERVKVKMQMSVIEALLSGGSDELNFEAALKALGSHVGEELVTVISDDETVHIWIDEKKTAD